MWTGESLLARRPHVNPGPLTVVSLQPPRDESLNGLLQGYRIYYRELEYEAASATESKTLKTPSALRAELTGEPSPPPARARQQGGFCDHSASIPPGLGHGGWRRCGSAPSHRRCARPRAWRGAESRGPRPVGDRGGCPEEEPSEVTVGVKGRHRGCDGKRGTQGPAQLGAGGRAGRQGLGWARGQPASARRVPHRAALSAAGLGCAGAAAGSPAFCPGSSVCSPAPRQTPPRTLAVLPAACQEALELLGRLPRSPLLSLPGVPHAVRGDT